MAPGHRVSAPLWALLLALGASATAPRLAVAQPEGGREVSQFQQPAEERSLDLGDGDGGDGDGRTLDGPAPENIEDRLFLRERPDALGAAAATHRGELLGRLLAEREGWVVERRNQAIALLERFIEVEPETAPEMPDALLRLAELRWELSRADYLNAFAAWQAVPAANQGPEPRADYRVSMALYDRILTRHRDFLRYDFVLYMKAYALLEAGTTDDALALYRQILADFPDSRFRPDAHFALAESAFTGRYDYAAALVEYENVMGYPQSELADLALFKSAWCMWRLGRSQEAALRFREVLDLERRRGAMTATQRRRLRDLQDEALDYLIQVFVEDEQNTAADVFRFLEEIGGERYARRVLVRLSETFMGQSRYERAVEAYRLLLEMDGTVPEAPDYQREIASAYAAVDDVENTIASLRVLAETYGADSTWASQQGDPQAVERASERTERTIRSQALRYHEAGQSQNQRPKFEQAAGLYALYLEHFEDREPAYQIQFYLAEILFHRLERFSEAGDAYLGAARRDHEGQFTRDALYNAIGAYERVREAEIERCAGDTGRGRQTRRQRRAVEAAAAEAAADGEEGDESDEGGAEAAPADEECGETENDQKFSDAIELYVQLFPEDPDLPEILFRQGRLYYDREIFDPAVRLFGQLLERFPTSDYAEPAGELILDSFNRADDYANIETWARRLKSAPAFQSAEKQRRLDGLILASIFKVGEQLAERNEHAEAANAYFRAAEEFPNDDRARQAYFNAGVERQRGGDLAGAAEAYDQLIERYPGSTEGALGAWTAAQMYESIAQFRDAAGYYEQYGGRFPEGEKVADALYNAVLLRVTAGDYAAAVTAGRSFLERFPRHEAADSVYFFIGRAHEGAEQWDDAADTYRQFVRRTRNLDLKVEAQTRLAIVLQSDGEARRANRALNEAVRLGRRNRSRLTEGLYFAAQARSLQGDAVLAEYEAIRIAGPSEGLADRLQQKSQLLQRAALIYADVVEFGVAEWITASLFQIGRSFELFAEAMREFELPPDLSEEQEMAYQDQLARFIIPMEERALEAYEGGYQRAIELRIFNRWTAQLREALTRLNDVQYPPLREAGGAIVEGAPLAPPQPIEALRRGQAEADEDDEEEDEAPRRRGRRRNRPGGDS